MRLLDLFCGRWGWSKAFAARGWECVGVDLIGSFPIPENCWYAGTKDVLNLDAAFLSAFDFICASSPCEEFSVFSMPHFHPKPKYPELGIKLFNHTESICEASGVPYVMENVRAAQKFVGPAMNHCGPFYLWGNAVPPLLPQGIKKGFQTGGQIIQRLKAIDRKALTDYRRLNDGSWSSSKSEKRREWTAKVATIPPELAGCVADYATRICTDALFSQRLDGERLGKQLAKVQHEMLCYSRAGMWRTLGEISRMTGYPEASISARLRDLRRMGYLVEKRRRGEPKAGGLQWTALRN